MFTNGSSLYMYYHTTVLIWIYVCICDFSTINFTKQRNANIQSLLFTYFCNFKIKVFSHRTMLAQYCFFLNCFPFVAPVKPSLFEATDKMNDHNQPTHSLLTHTKIFFWYHCSSVTEIRTFLYILIKNLHWNLYSLWTVRKVRSRWMEGRGRHKKIFKTLKGYLQKDGLIVGWGGDVLKSLHKVRE